MRRIPLLARDGSIRAYALLDDIDYERLRSYRWLLQSAGYAIRHVGRAVGRGMRLMHRDVLDVADGDPREVDHRNQDKLDNRRANLRLIDPAFNKQNVPAQRGTSSRFRGVSWVTREQRWRAGLKTDGRYRFVGDFDDELDAARAVDAARRELLPYAERDPLLPEEG